MQRTPSKSARLELNVLQSHRMKLALKVRSNTKFDVVLQWQNPLRIQVEEDVEIAKWDDS